MIPLLVSWFLGILNKLLTYYSFFHLSGSPTFYKQYIGLANRV